MASNDEASASFEESDLISLGEKLATLDLTDPERAALGALISDDDVVGFARFNIAAGIRVGYRVPGKRADVRGPGADPGARANGVRANWDSGDGIAPKPGRF